MAVWHRLPDARLWVSVIVPVYHELSNGNIYRFLQDFARQDADWRTFEVVLLVNNTPQDAAQHNAAFVDNLRSLQLGDYINTPRRSAHPPAFVLEAWAALIPEVRRTSAQLRFLDCSSTGMARHMGCIRNQGILLAVSHFETLGVDGLIANLDADTAIPENYISQLVYFAALPHMAVLAALTRSPNPIIRMLSATASAEIPTLSSTVARTVLQPSAHEAVTHLRTLYPDWPHALSDTPFREDCVYLQAFEKFICLAKHRPSLAPGMHALLVEVTGHHFTTYVAQ